MRLFLIRYKNLAVALTLLSVSLFFMSTKIDKDKIYLRSYLFGVLFSFEKSLLDIKNSLVDVFINTKNIKELEEELENSEQEVLYYKEYL